MTGQQDRFLIVNLRGERLALRLDDITEVRETFRTYPIPKAPAYYLGVMNSHGSPTPILDPAAFLYGDSPRDAGTLLLLDHRIGTLALRIDRVERIISAAPPVEAEESGDGLTEQAILHNEETFRLLDLEKLVTRLEDDFLLGAVETVRPPRHEKEEP
jgi:chemotaxis signal transduction protein